MSQIEKFSDSSRVKNVVVDGDGNLVVTIIKYSWFTCLFHSFYSLILLALLVGAVISLIEEWWMVSIVLFLIGIFMWMQTWVNANDRLKKRIYPRLFIEYLGNKSLQTQGIVRFDPHTDLLFVVSPDGEIKRHKVEFVMEDLPVYMVKIHSLPELK